MNTRRILELLETTPQVKLETLKQMEQVNYSPRETANEMLNEDLFGVSSVTPKAATESVVRRSLKGRPSQRKPFTRGSKESLSDKLKQYCQRNNSFTSRAQEDVEDVSPENELTPIEIFEEALRVYYTTKIDELGEEGAEAFKNDLKQAVCNIIGCDEEDGAADEAVAQEGCKRKASRRPRRSNECVHTEAKNEFMREASEMLIKTAKDCKFPESLTFDEEAFGEEYGIDAKTVSCIYVPEDIEAQIAEAIEISFEYEGSNITLRISADGAVEETVDAEQVPAQFSAVFTQEEKEDGSIEDILLLNLIEDEGEDTEGVVKSEEDALTKSEGDEEHKDEEGKGPTDEFIEEAGLNIDPFYSEQHGMKTADKGTHTIRNGFVKKQAKESLAARIIRTSK